MHVTAVNNIERRRPLFLTGRHVVCSVSLVVTSTSIVPCQVPSKFTVPSDTIIAFSSFIAAFNSRLTFLLTFIKIIFN